MASKPGPLSVFPWERLGNYKYLLFAPFAAVVAWGMDDADEWCLHMLALAGCRYALAQAFITASRTHSVSGKHRIQKSNIGFEQMDREENWDDFILLQAVVMTVVHLVLPGFHSFPKMDVEGLGKCLLLHMGPTEFAYYWFHRALHHHSLYKQYHSHHHKSFVTDPVSGSCHPFLEHVGYTANFAIPMLGTWLWGGASLAMFYAYTLGFDTLNMVGHCNWEFVPHWLYATVPGLRYLLYTPSYHSLHHSRVHTNFCLFMPVYDWLGGTLEVDKHSGGAGENREVGGWTSLRVQKEARGRGYQTPACVFLAHGTDLLSAVHLPMFLRGLASRPYAFHWALAPLWPLCALGCALLWCLGCPVFTSHVERLSGEPVQTWVVPRFGFQYFLGPKEEARINGLIADAIVAADRAGVRVFGLGALNKAEHLNGGGAIFPALLESARRRQRTASGAAAVGAAGAGDGSGEGHGEGGGISIVHGNTLTAACLLREISPTTREVFLTGATSKLGRATALYLSQVRGVKVRMLTGSESRFDAIVAECAPEARHLLTRATSHAEGADVAAWVVAKPCGAKAQACAPPGCHFHQVVVPPIEPHRAHDCTYGALAAMDLPASAADTKACELFLPRRRVFACHAGALTHTLSGWTHHEVGAIDVARIDVCWRAAVGLGFRPAAEAWPPAAQAAFAAELETLAAAQAAGGQAMAGGGAAAKAAFSKAAEGAAAPRVAALKPKPVAAPKAKMLTVVAGAADEVTRSDFLRVTPPGSPQRGTASSSASSSCSAPPLAMEEDPASPRTAGTWALSLALGAVKRKVGGTREVTKAKTEEAAKRQK